MTATVTIDAPAKVNLALRVGPAGGDGYHDVTTVMLTVGLADTLTATLAQTGVSLVRDPDPGFPAEDDLTVRAVRALAAATGSEPAVSLRLEKHIPIAAGLGGGSADCAAALVACCRLWSIDPRDSVVTEVARALGADVPFMVRGGCALYGGRGDARLSGLPTPELDFVLVNAGVPVPTADVYRAFDATCPAGCADVDAAVSAVESGDRRALAHALANDLTGAALAVAPAIADVIDFMGQRPGLLGVLLAGSGGTVFAVADGAESARTAADAARHLGWWAVATSSSGPRDSDDSSPLRVY